MEDNKPIDASTDAQLKREEMITQMNAVMDDVLRRITYDEIQTGWQRYISALVKRIRKRAGVSQLTQRHMDVINDVVRNGRGTKDVSGTSGTNT